MMSEEESDPIAELLKGQLFSMAHQLTDLTRRNIALNYATSRSSGLDLAKGIPIAVAKLLSGEDVPIAEIFPKQTNPSPDLALLGESDEPPNETSEGDPTSLRTAKNQYSFAASLQEEKGVWSYWFASHAIEWNHDGKPYRAPLFVIPAFIRPLGYRGGYSVSIDFSESARINQSLESFMKLMFNLDLEVELEDEVAKCDEGFIPIDFGSRNAMADRLTQIVNRVVDVELDQEFQVLDNFNFAKLPIVGDLRSLAFLELARNNPVILAMLGIDQEPLAAQSSSGFSVESLDVEHPGMLPIIADANASQLVALKTVMDGSHLVIQGPPGTGKSQTIANLIGLLAAEGKKVLFVAEKQAAILAVVEILEAHGLGHLLLPLNGESSSKKALARIQQNLDRASSIRPANVDLGGIAQVHGTLRQRRALLAEVIAPSEFSVIELIGFWSNVPGDLESDEILDTSSEKWLKAVPDGFQSIKDLARRMSVSGYLDTAAKNSSWAEINLAEMTHNSELEAKLKGCKSTLLTEKAQEQVAPVFSLPIAEAWEIFSPLVVFATAELTVVEQLTDEQAYQYGRAFNLGPIGGMTLRFEGTLLERRRQRREFKRLLTSSKNRSREVVRKLVAARLALSSAGLAHPPRKDAEHIVEAGTWVSTLLNTTKSLFHHDGVSVQRASAIVDGCLRDLDSVPRAREWSKIREGLNELELREDLLGVFGSGLSQSGAQNLLSGVLSGRLVRGHLRSGSMLGIIDPKELCREFTLEDQKIFSQGARRVASASAAWTTSKRNANPTADQELREQLAKRRGGMSIRRLFHEMPEAVLAINPCLALSPVQVSSYLPQSELFDIVIFDEASQITPIEAIPSIARGSRVVVAGDKHQLPPTEFFDAQATVEELEIVDTESVLKKLEVIFPSQWLNIHYRSSDDRLIAVAAEHVYWALSRLRLLTIPSAERREDCIRFVQVESDPISMKGTRTSGDDEIEVVVREVFSHFERCPEQSLGVITLSREHCERIETAIERARRSRRDLDAFFSQEGKKKFFVKNIERVQGDERDAIIVSTGYQRNAAGQLPQNFGPIGKREGGYRRVNVMISRAKMSMMLISAFNSGDIRAQSAGYGVQLLHTYFRFMETGGQVLSNAERVEEPMNPFELSIFEEIRARGIEVVPQLGVSGYWIDFALVHPEKPGVYVLAVEADGATYHSIPTARERDRLRQEHLEAKGFRFHRVWSTDWFRNRRAETDRIFEAFEQAILEFDSGTSTLRVPTAIQPVEADQEEGLTPPIPEGVKGLPVDQIPIQVLDNVMAEARKLNPHRSETEIIEIAFKALGFSRRGSRIMGRLESSANRTQPPSE